jgi:hypothetical protein
VGFLGIGFLRHCKYSIQFGYDFGVYFCLRHETGEDMIVRLPKHIGQAEFLEEPVKERIQKIITGFHIRRPRIRPSQSLEGNCVVRRTLWTCKEKAQFYFQLL